MPAPDQQVLDGRDQAAFAALRIGVRGPAEACLGVAEIAGGETRDHGVDFVRQQRAGHAERLEDALAENVPQLLAGDLLDDQAEQQEVAVAVEEAAGRLEVEMAGAPASGQQVGRPRRLVEAVSAQPQELEEIGQPAGIAHHLVESDGQRLELGQILVRRVGEVELAFVGQHQRGADRELLADRSDAKARRGPDRHAELDAGKAVALAQLDRAGPHDGDSGARRTGLGVVGEQRVDAMLEGDGSDRIRHEMQSSQAARPCKAEALR